MPAVVSTVLNWSRTFLASSSAAARHLPRTRHQADAPGEVQRVAHQHRVAERQRRVLARQVDVLAHGRGPRSERHRPYHQTGRERYDDRSSHRFPPSTPDAAAGDQQALRDLQHVHGPAGRGPWPLGARRERPAAQHHRAPLRRDGVAPVHRAEQRSRDGARSCRCRRRAGPWPRRPPPGSARAAARRRRSGARSCTQPWEPWSHTGGSRRAASSASRTRSAASLASAHSTAARHAPSAPSPTRTAWASATTNAAVASPQTGLGCVRLASCRASSAASGGSKRMGVDAERARAHQRAVGLARGVGVVAERAPRPFRRRRTATSAASRGRRRAPPRARSRPARRSSARAPAPSRSRRSAARPAGSSGRRLRAGAGRPARGRAIAARVSNSTSAPRLSPATWPEERALGAGEPPASRDELPPHEPRSEGSRAGRPARRRACATAARAAAPRRAGVPRRRTRSGSRPRASSRRSRPCSSTSRTPAPASSAWPAGVVPGARAS